MQSTLQIVFNSLEADLFHGKCFQGCCFFTTDIRNTAKSILTFRDECSPHPKVSFIIVNVLARLTQWLCFMQGINFFLWSNGRMKVSNIILAKMTKMVLRPGKFEGKSKWMNQNLIASIIFDTFVDLIFFFLCFMFFVCKQKILRISMQNAAVSHKTNPVVTRRCRWQKRNRTNEIATNRHFMV